MSDFDLSQLPPPSLLEALSFEEILARKKAKLLELAPDLADTLDLESEPVTKLLEVSSYDELLIRQRVNDVLRAHILAFAVGADLDQLASFYHITRLDGEDDESFRRRIQLGIRSWTPGSMEFYRDRAMGFGTKVRDAFSEAPVSGVVRVSILPQGESDPELIEDVSQFLTRKDTRLLGDTVEVVEATLIPITVHADIYTRPDAPPGIISTLKTSFPPIFEESRGLGWNLAKSWIDAKLHAPGVKRVDIKTPADNIVVPNNACVILENLTLIDKGSEW
uniref:Phage-related baseplate assembly protein n=1 Tax=Candidatus Kentrum sp. LFY TaxID=2126342 RepID=A0A450W779_9GAMM|nr:MAG: Phage-related baseplate assembly protein [Candidatus Kentron sp. LFY]